MSLLAFELKVSIVWQKVNLPAWLELRDLPYTGATPRAMILCFDKQVVRLVARFLGVEVPREAHLPACAPREDLPASIRRC